MTDAFSQSTLFPDEPLIKPNFRTSRHQRPFSLYSKPNSDCDLNKVIIPYNFEESQYKILKESIEFYDKKDYLVEKLNAFNKINSFQIQNKYKASFFQQIGVYLPCLVIFALFLYLGIIILAFFSFNPVLIYTLVIWSRHLWQSLKSTRLVFIDKFRINKINSILDEENVGGFCIQNNLHWWLGQSGYWLELEKVI